MKLELDGKQYEVTGFTIDKRESTTRRSYFHN
jgi:hypothetical protein